MVCNRCIKVVKDELEKLGLDVEDIKLGEVTVSSEKTISKENVQTVLEENGFEILEDKSVKLIEKIKTLIISLVHHKSEGQTLSQNYSEIISREVGKDYHYLSQLFSAKEGITIEKFIIQQKIERVKELLIYDELSLSEIAYELNYSSVAYLSNQFKQITGMTPSQFKSQKKGRKPLDMI